MIPTESQNSGLGFKVCVNSEEPGKFYADAITKGNHIFLSAGAEGLLRHEMGHIIQQRRGRVSATRTVAGQQLNDSVSLEREADRLGSMIPQQVVSGVLSAAGRGVSMQEADGVVQCGKGGGKENIEKIVLELTDSIDRLKKLSTIEGSNTLQDKLEDKNQALGEGFKKSIIEIYKRRLKKRLQEKIHEIYPYGSEDFINGLIQRIESGGVYKNGTKSRKACVFWIAFQSG